MELKVISEKENPLFDRLEVIVRFTGYTASPSRIDIAPMLATQFKTDAACIHIEKVDCPYGGVVADVSASIYKDAATLEKYTPAKRRLRLIKNKPGKKK
jgi:ribosomal protein S24E